MEAAEAGRHLASRQWAAQDDRVSNRWSSLRAQLHDRWAASVAERLDVHVTSYHKAHLHCQHEDDNRVWFTWDGVEIADFSGPAFVGRTWELINSDAEGVGIFLDRATEIAKAENLTDQWTFRESARTYLALSIAEALDSPDPFVRGLAMLDRRVGQRRLASPALAAEQHPFVRQLYDLRCEAEEIVPASVG